MRTSQREAAVLAELLQHVVEEAEAGGDGGFGDAVQVDVDPDPGFLGVALAPRRGAAHRPVHGRCRASPTRRRTAASAAGSRGCRRLSANCDVGVAVADHRRARPVDAAVLQVGQTRPTPGLRVGALSCGQLQSISTSRNTMPWLSKICSIRSLRAVEGFARIAVAAEAVLVADDHELVAGIAQLQQCAAITSLHEAHLFVGVDLEVGRLLDQRAVAVDEQDRGLMRRLRCSKCGEHAVVLLRRADGDAQRIAQLRRGAQSRTTMPAASSGRNADCGIVEAHQQEIALRRIDPRHARRCRPAPPARGCARERTSATRSRGLGQRCRRQARPAPVRRKGSAPGRAPGSGAAPRSAPASAISHADARGGQRMRLGQRAQHDEVGVTRPAARLPTAIAEIRHRPRRPPPARALAGRCASRSMSASANRAAGRIGGRAQEHQLARGLDRRAGDRVEIGLQGRRARRASGTSISGACRRAHTAYMPNTGGVMTTASWPGTQSARTSRSMASSLPRPTSSCDGIAAIERGQRAAQGAGCGRDSDGSWPCVSAGLAPGRFVGVQPDIALQRFAARRTGSRRNRAGPRAPGQAGRSCRRPPACAARHRIGVRIQSFRRGQRHRAGTDARRCPQA